MKISVMAVMASASESSIMAHQPQRREIIMAYVMAALIMAYQRLS